MAATVLIACWCDPHSLSASGPLPRCTSHTRSLPSPLRRQIHATTSVHTKAHGHRHRHRHTRHRQTQTQTQRRKSQAGICNRRTHSHRQTTQETGANSSIPTLLSFCPLPFPPLIHPPHPTIHAPYSSNPLNSQPSAANSQLSQRKYLRPSC